MKDLRIKRLTVTQYKWKRRDLTGDYNGFNHVYLKVARSSSPTMC